MGYVKEPKSVGGMINSIGYSEQDCASVKYMFEYLDNGLKEISFESENDFCIVLDSGEKLSIQTKINQFTLDFVSKMLKESKINGKTIFVGSGYDDGFRNLIQDKARYIAANESVLCEDKEMLFFEIDECCKKKNIETSKFLICDFMILDGINRDAVAKNAIDTWARRKGVFIDTDGLFNELVALIGNKLRTIGGHLSKTEIKEIINKHRNSKIESFISKRDRVSSVIEEVNKKDIEEYLDNLAVKYTRIHEIIVLIKYELLNDQLVEARNRIEDILSLCPELKSILLMVLNMIGDYDSVIDKECGIEKDDKICIVEYAKAHMCRNEFEISNEHLQTIGLDEWDEVVFYISAINYHGMGNDETAQKYLEHCIKLNVEFVDAYVFLASLIYVLEPERAAEYLDIALGLDSKCAKAYLLRAEISQLYDDFSCVIDNYEKYIFYSGDDENDQVLLLIAINKYHIDSEDWQLAFYKWNEAFRINNDIVGEVNIPVIDLGKSYFCCFSLQSLEDGLTVYCNSQEIFSYNKQKNIAKTAIGLYMSQNDVCFYKFTSQNIVNPIRKSMNNIKDEFALPTIFKFYDTKESYEYALNNLLKQGVLYSGCCFLDNTKEYKIYENDIDMRLVINKNKLSGGARIGKLSMNIEINQCNKGLELFKEKLNKNCANNEAAIMLVFDKEYYAIITFPRKKIKISMIE